MDLTFVLRSVQAKLFYLPDVLPIKRHYHYSHLLKIICGYTYRELQLYHDKITFNAIQIQEIIINNQKWKLRSLWQNCKRALDMWGIKSDHSDSCVPRVFHNKSHFNQPHFAQFFPELCTFRVIFKANGMQSEKN